MCEWIPCIKEKMMMIKIKEQNTSVPRYTGSVAIYCLKTDFQVYQIFKLNA